MSNASVEKEQSLEKPDGNPESEKMKGEETQQVGSIGQITQSDDEQTSMRPIPKAEDYDFFLNVRRREQKEPTENDEPTEH